MKDKEPQFTVYVVTGEAFKFYMEIACAAFHISAPFVNASRLEFTYTDQGGNIIKTHFIWGHHWDLLDKDTEIRFVTLGTGEEHEVLWKQSGLHARYFTIFLLMGHFYLYANSSSKLSDPIRTSEQLEELQKAGANIDFSKINENNMFLFMEEKSFEVSAESTKDLNENQTAYLEEIESKNDYDNYIYPEMLQLYNFINDWKNSEQDKPLTLQCGGKKLKLENTNNWIFGVLNHSFDNLLVIKSVEEAQDELAFNYSKKAGRKANNKHQTLILKGAQDIFKVGNDSDEITNQYCEFVRDLLKHFHLSISKDDFNHDDDIKNIRSRMRYLQKNSSKERWGATGANDFYPASIKYILDLYKDA